MSSRALRKAQKEREAALLAAQEETEDDEPELPTRAQPSAFALLEEEEDNADEYSDTVSEKELPVASARDDQDTDEDDVGQPKTTSQTPLKASAKKKKKKRKTKKPEEVTSKDGPQDLDDIDRALKALSTTGTKSGGDTPVAGAPDPAVAEICKLLAVDTANLRVENEMRRLFGKVAFEPEHTEDPRSHRQRAAQNEGVPLSEAVKGRYAAGGAGLSAVLRRRNIFIPGKEDWPKATGGGLTMDILETRPGGIVEYTYTHNKAYQQQQREFESCVNMMDPTIMINLLRFNPYHCSLLLQVSEIARVQDRDPATSGELLERALFSFGRAVHSSFPQNLAAGKARLDFRRPENREFWLAAWKYIGNIGLRATWRTAYEWVKLLLSLDPENDPYCIRLVIDQMAIRARQPQHFLDLCQSKFFSERWKLLPNIYYSKALALKMSNPQGQEAAQVLTDAVQRFPWVACRLFHELNIDKIPQGIWGASAHENVDHLYLELYVSQGLDLWKLPEALKFLTDTVSKVSVETIKPVDNMAEITLDEARFTYLTDKPALIALIPQEITSRVESGSDPLPPEDDLRSYETGSRAGGRGIHYDPANSTPAAELVQEDPLQFAEEIHVLQRFFAMLMPDIEPPVQDEQTRRMPGSFADDEEQLSASASRVLSQDDLEEVMARSQLTPAEVRAYMNRYLELREVLAEQPGRTVRSDNGEEVALLEDGRLRSSLRFEGNN